MKRSTLAAAVLAAVFAAPAAFAQAQPAAAPAKPAVQVAPIAVDVDAEQITTKILSVDQANRLVTVETAAGPLTLHVPDSVKRLSEIKAGDTLRITYNHAVAVMLKRGGQPIRSGTSAQSGGAVKQAGTVAAGAAMKEGSIVANITAVDAAKNRVTVQGPAGRVMTFKLAEPGIASQIKVGDQVEVAYREAVAVQVLPGAAAAPAAKK
jgi:formylmethanofuran dehydrogenase subunit C